VIGIIPLIYGLAAVLMGELLSLHVGEGVLWPVPLLVVGFALIVGGRTVALHTTGIA